MTARWSRRLRPANGWPISDRARYPCAGLVGAPVRKLRFADVFVSRNGPCQCPHNPRNNPYWQELKFTVPCRDARGSDSESLGADSRWSKLIRAKLSTDRMPGAE